MNTFSHESDVYYLGNNVSLRKNFLKYILTDFDDFNKNDFNEIINWLLSGKFGYEPYTEFYEEYLLLKNDDKIKLKIYSLLDSLKQTGSLSETCDKLKIPINKVNIWLELGKNGEIPFDIIYKEYESFVNYQLEQKIENFLKIFNGFNEIESCSKSNISQVQLASWLRLNKLGGIFEKLYNQYLKIIINLDLGELFDFNGNEKISKNTLDLLFILSAIGKVKYPDFCKDYNLFFKNNLKNNIKYPESYIEQFLDSFHNHHKRKGLKFLNLHSINTCDVLDLVDSKSSNQEFYKQKNIDDFLNYIALGYDDFESAKLANIGFNLIDNWLNNGIPQLAYDTFFEDYNSALILNGYLEFLREKIDLFITYLNNAESIKNICKSLVLSFNDVELYLNLGYLGYEPYTVFYNEFEKSLKYEKKKKNDLDIFLKEVENGKFKSQAVRKSKIKVKDVNEFIEKGNDGINPYDLFLTDYKLALIKNYESNKDSKVVTFFDEIKNGKSFDEASKISKIPVEVFEFWISLNIFKDLKINYFKAKDSKYFLSSYVDARKTFLKNVKGGLNKSDACKNLPFSVNTVDIWLEKGQLNEEPYVEFYEDYNIASGYFKEDYKLGREIFLKYIERGMTKNNAIKKCPLSALEIDVWLNLGEDGVEPYNEFYSQYKNAIETYYFYDSNSVIREKFLMAIEEGHSIDSAISKYGVQALNIRKWLYHGKNGIKPYDKFYDKFVEVKNFSYFSISNNEIRRKFLKDVESGFSKSDSIKRNNLPENKINNWLLKGSGGKKPYNEFYKEFREALSRGFYDNHDVDLFFNEIASLSLKSEALEKIKMPIEDFNIFYEKGKNKDKIYRKFYLDYNAALEKFFKSEPESKREIFINDIAKGLSLEESLIDAKLSMRYFDKCVELNEDSRFIKTFYNRYQKAKSDGYYFRVMDNNNGFFKLIENGETIEDASEISGLNLKKVKSWIANGKKETSKYHEFFDNYLKAAIKFYCLDDTASKRKNFLKFISKGSSKDESCDKSNLNAEHLKQWFSLAKRNINPFVEFEQDYEDAVIRFFNSKRNAKKLDKILKFVEMDKTLNEACKKVNLEASLVRSWLNKGKNNNEPYIEFYNKYNQSLVNQLNKYETEIEEFFNLIANGETNKGACKILKLDYKMINSWIANGRNGNEIYKEFYEKYDEIRKNK